MWSRNNYYGALFVLIATLVCMLGAAESHPAADAPKYTPHDEAAARKAYSEQVLKNYSLPFAKDKYFLPGNASTEGNQFIEPGEFMDAKYCGHCHQEAYREWRQSLHGNSFRSPFYRFSVNILVRSKGIEYARHCDSCHNPIAVFAGAMTPDSTINRLSDRDGLTCTTCHSIVSVQSKLGNGGYEMAVPSALVDEKGIRIPGWVPDAEILAHLDRHAKAVMQPIYRTPEYCEACHKANLPPMLNGYKWIRAFTTYDEWEDSKFSNRNPLTFYTADYTTCQGCHMKRIGGDMVEPGAKNGTFANHRWVAGNTAVPFYFGYQEQLDKTLEFLKSGTFLNVDIFGLKIGKECKLAAPLGNTGFTVHPSDLLEADVVIQNKNIGHSLLPEVRDLYEMWVQFTATDANGKVIYESGYMLPNGSHEPSAHTFDNRPVNVKGEFVDNHVVADIHSVAYDNTIQSGRSAVVRYQFQLPPDAVGPIQLTARINYRHIRQSYLDNIFGKDHPAYPVVEVAARTRKINIGENHPEPAQEGDNPEWMRWNNLGIGYLDQLQYDQALEAFQNVVRLRPDYKDGFINIGLTYLEWEKYDQARGPIETALAIHPDDARALYYLALIERRQRHSEAEVADLEKVVAQYPQCRDARRELGISYYQQHRPQDAILQFKALQAIDPDDLAAHYNLAILYRRSGMKRQSEAEAAQYRIKEIDPGAPTYSLDYLRKHPELSIESVPWHVHSSMPAHMTEGSTSTCR